MAPMMHICLMIAWAPWDQAYGAYATRSYEQQCRCHQRHMQDLEPGVMLLVVLTAWPQWVPTMGVDPMADPMGGRSPMGGEAPNGRNPAFDGAMAAMDGAQAANMAEGMDDSQHGR